LTSPMALLQIEVLVLVSLDMVTAAVKDVVTTTAHSELRTKVQERKRIQGNIVIGVTSTDTVEVQPPEDTVLVSDSYSGVSNNGTVQEDAEDGGTPVNATLYSSTADFQDDLDGVEVAANASSQDVVSSSDAMTPYTMTNTDGVDIPGDPSVRALLRVPAAFTGSTIQTYDPEGYLPSPSPQPCGFLCNSGPAFVGSEQEPVIVDSTVSLAQLKQT